MSSENMRVNIGKRKVRSTGGSKAITYPNFVLQNTTLTIENEAFLFTCHRGDEIVVTGDPRDVTDGELMGSRKVRRIGGTTAITLPSKLCEKYDLDDEARISIDPIKNNLVVEI
jgi:antitoxin component of MazEF toxin-antitoxin module